MGISIKKLNRLLCYFLLACLCLAPVQPVFADLSLEKKQRVTHEKIRKLRFLETLETNRLLKNQKKLEKTKQKLDSSKVQYASAQMRLGMLEQEYRKAQRQLKTVSSQVQDRIRLIYKKQRVSLLCAVLSSKDINTFSDILYYQNLIMKKDKQKFDKARTIARRLENIREQIRREQAILDQSISTMSSQQRSIQQAIENNSTMIEKLKTDRAYYEKTERELAKQSASLGKMIKQSHSSSDIKIASKFMKPVAGHISSPFGYRTHPIFKSRIFHSGIDIAGPAGANIRAANSGKVIFVNWYGGYGKVVIIDHGMLNGKNVTTLYAHLSQFKTSVGAHVVKGQVIGIEGSTGYSTGPHLHFEVRLNGQPTNPLNYIGL